MVRRGKTALLVPPRNQRPAGKPFGETLASRGEFILRRLGVADQCLIDQTSFSETLSCWFSPSLEITNLDFDPHGKIWNINRQIFDNVLLTIAIEAGAEILDRQENLRFRFERHTDGWRVHIGSLATIAKRWLKILSMLRANQHFLREARVASVSFATTSLRCGVFETTLEIPVRSSLNLCGKGGGTPSA